MLVLRAHVVQLYPLCNERDNSEEDEEDVAEYEETIDEAEADDILFGRKADTQDGVALDLGHADPLLGTTHVFPEIRVFI